MVIQILAGIGLVGYSLALVLYVVEAWQQSLWHAVFCLIIPFYVFYFAYIRSERDVPYRLVLVGSAFFFLVFPAIVSLVRNLGAPNV